MQVRLLGSIDVLVNGAAREVPGLRRKAVLATLAVRPGEIVSTDQIVDAVWGQHPPGNAVATLHNHVSRLRAVLEDRAAIVARGPGYLLNLGEDATDVRAAQRLIDAAGDCADPGERERLLREAVALWRGRPLADFAGPAGLLWFDQHARHLEQLGLQAQLSLLDTRLELGQHAQLLPDLEKLAAGDPWNEQVHRQLMVALYRAGRQSDALAVYRRLRDTLADELGVEPGVELRKLETAILRHDPILAAPTPPVPGPVPGASAADARRSERTSLVAPAQLPAAVATFVGRARELTILDSCRPSIDTDPGSSHAQPGAARIITVGGTAGVGKTTLAVQWAHRVAARFPDGQLYVNLRGFDPRAAPLDPATALRDFLEALGVAPQRLPIGLDALAALYRSALSGRRLLVLLDNVRDADQVRPLLPAGLGCLVVVTSRAKLTSLIAVEGAFPIMLDVLADADARQLIAHRIGARRAAAEAAALDEMAALCARLPLALAIVGARAASEPAISLDVYVRRLGDRADALELLYAGDSTADLRTVFSWSLNAVSVGARRLFRLLGLHPGVDITAAAASCLVGSAPIEAARHLVELVEANLLSEPRAGRYTFHDLLRAYAAERVQRDDSEEERRAATVRLLDYYLHTAYAGARLLTPLVESITTGGPAQGVNLEQLADPQAAATWFFAERHVLLALVDHAVTEDLPRHAWQIAWSINTDLYRAGFWLDLAAILGKGAAAAGDTGDLRGRASCLRLLGSLYANLGRHDDARAAAMEALGIVTELGDVSKRALCHADLGFVLYEQGRTRHAIGHLRDALHLAREVGDLATQGLAFNNLGWAHTDLGEFRAAIDLFEHALPLVRAVGERDYETDIWIGFGRAHHALGDHEQAINCYRTAVELADANEHQLNRAEALTYLGETLEAAGNSEEARTAWRSALEILTAHQHLNAERVRALLAGEDDDSNLDRT